MSINSRTITVTGGAGFIGSHLTEYLLNLGCEVVVADDFSRGSFGSIEHLLGDDNFVPVDLSTREGAIHATEGVDDVFHIAAITNAPETFDIPEETWEVNHEAALSVYDLAREAGAKEFVNVSTCSVYGRTQ